MTHIVVPTEFTIHSHSALAGYFLAMQATATYTVPGTWSAYWLVTYKDVTAYSALDGAYAVVAIADPAAKHEARFILVRDAAQLDEYYLRANRKYYADKPEH